MKAINRSAITVVPAQPFLDWLHRVDPTSADVTIADLRRDPAIYLLPEYDRDDEALEGLQEVVSEIFEEQLAGWYRAPSAWPRECDLHTFLRWFEYHCHSMVFDLGTAPLLHQE
jgi:hypothetical protein